MKVHESLLLPLASCSEVNEESNEQIDVFQAFFIFKTVSTIKKMNLHPTLEESINIVVQGAAECSLFIKWSLSDGCIKCCGSSLDLHPSAVSPPPRPLSISRAGSSLSFLDILGISKWLLLKILTSLTG